APLYPLPSCHVRHPSLHSFPTRRSSDLRLAGVTHPFVGERRRLIRADGMREARLHPAQTPSRHAAARIVSGALALDRLAGNPRQDRKSTRLNSSHGSISYAVFCLNKKNI